MIRIERLERRWGKMERRIGCGARVEVVHAMTRRRKGRGGRDSARNGRGGAMDAEVEVVHATDAEAQRTRRWC